MPGPAPGTTRRRTPDCGNTVAGDPAFDEITDFGITQIISRPKRDLKMHASKTFLFNAGGNALGSGEQIQEHKLAIKASLLHTNFEFSLEGFDRVSGNLCL